MNSPRPGSLRPGFRPSRPLTLCAASLLFAGISSLVAQLADIPIKPGLWNTQVIVKLDATDTDNQPISDQACFTAGTTISSYLAAMTRSAPDVKCIVTNKVQTAHRVSFDTACTSSTMASKSHHDFQLTDADHFSGTSHTTIAGNVDGHPINREMSKTFTAVFQSSNCGDVKPLTDQPAH
jgi:hypothetical protein